MEIQISTEEKEILVKALSEALECLSKAKMNWEEYNTIVKLYNTLIKET